MLKKSEKHIHGQLEDYPLSAACDFSYGLDIAGIPVGMAGQASLLRNIIAPESQKARQPGYTCNEVTSS